MTTRMTEATWAETMVCLAELGAPTAAGRPVSDLTLREIKSDPECPARLAQRAALCLANRADSVRRDARAAG